MNSFVSATAVLALAASATMLRAAPGEPLQPTGKWVVDYGDNGCVLQRSYGGARDPLTFGIKPELMGPGVSLIIIEKGIGGHKLEGPVTISFGTDGGAIESQLGSIRKHSPPVRRHETHFQMNELKRAVTTERIDLKSPGTIDVRLAVPTLGGALQALDQCVAELLERWGFSRPEQTQLASFARPRGGQLPLSASDYPETALRDDASGDAAARVRVGADGRASDCQIVATSKSKALDEATCKVLLRARYEPAISKAGGPVASVYIQVLRWRVF